MNAPSAAQLPPIGAELDALFTEHSGSDRVRSVYGVYRALISAALCACVDMGALSGELRFAQGLAAVARGVERIGVRHLRIVLAREGKGAEAT